MEYVVNDDFFKLNKLTQKILWTEEQKDYIKKQYLSQKSTTILGKEFGVAGATIRILLIKMGVEIRKAPRKYKRDSNYFNAIDTEEKAYWLGFLYADGSVLYNNKHKSVRLGLQIEDEHHVEKFKQAIKAEQPIKTGKKVMNGKTYYNKYIDITDYDIVGDLIKLGCVENKSLILKFPTEEQVPKEWRFSFIRGYFDGDGCIKTNNAWYQKKDGTYGINYTIRFLGTLDVILNIKRLLGIEHLKTIEYENRNKFYGFEVSGNQQVYNLLKNYIYKDATIYLERKYQKFLELEQYIHNNAR